MLQSKKKDTFKKTKLNCINGIIIIYNLIIPQNGNHINIALIPAIERAEMETVFKLGLSEKC